jgi:hypothetical protein
MEECRLCGVVDWLDEDDLCEDCAEDMEEGLDLE